jgi:hypothetical protein
MEQNFLYPYIIVFTYALNGIGLHRQESLLGFSAVTHFMGYFYLQYVVNTEPEFYWIRKFVAQSLKTSGEESANKNWEILVHPGRYHTHVFSCITYFYSVVRFW